MSTPRNFFIAGAIAALTIGAFTVAYTRKPKTRLTSEHWLRLLSGANIK
jgi:hypothetical protein